MKTTISFCFLILINLSAFAQGDLKLVSAFDSYACAASTNDVYCWGQNQYGQVQNIEDLSNVRELKSASEYACALDDLGVTCWGKYPFVKPEMNGDASHLRLLYDAVC